MEDPLSHPYAPKLWCHTLPYPTPPICMTSFMNDPFDGDAVNFTSAPGKVFMDPILQYIEDFS